MPPIVIQNTANNLIESWKIDNDYSVEIANINNNCFLSYMQLHGFPHIVRTYKGGHEITFDIQDLKKCNRQNKQSIEYLLRSLGSFRIYTINYLFTEALKEIPEPENHFLNASGSNNITSDYDITIVGPYSCLLIEKMFNKFYEMFGTVLPIAFDTNLYPGCVSFPSVAGANEVFQGENIPKGYLRLQIEGRMCMLPINPDKNSILHSYQWCCVKLFKAFNLLKFDFSVFIQIRKHLNEGMRISQLCNSYFCEISSNNSSDIIQKEILKLKKENKYMCDFGKHLDAYYRDYPSNGSELPHRNLRNGNKLEQYVDSILGYSSLIRWLCSEAYYSSYTVYAIVVGLQLGYDGDGFNEHIWLVAIYENLADMIIHMLHAFAEIHDDSIDNYKKVYITYSKYYYRIYYCLYKYYLKKGNTEVADEKNKKVQNLKETVLPRRKDFNLELANQDNIWSSIFQIKNLRDPEAWLKGISHEILSELDDKIVRSVGGRKKRKSLFKKSLSKKKRTRRKRKKRKTRRKRGRKSPKRRRKSKRRK